MISVWAFQSQTLTETITELQEQLKVSTSQRKQLASDLDNAKHSSDSLPKVQKELEQTKVS